MTGASWWEDTVTCRIEQSSEDTSALLLLLLLPGDVLLLTFFTRQATVFPPGCFCLTPWLGLGGLSALNRE